jgi:hypothetical protein
MKEFSAETGGRYTYADDIENLQELSLAFAQIFDDCDNFIVSGCEVSSGSISAGYVYLNGRLRKFSGATGISSWPQYIYELNSTESVPYESGTTKVGRNVYGCAVAKSVPVTKDPLTSKVPQSISIASTGGKRMKDAFIGKYALLLNPASDTQTVNSAVNFSKTLQALGSLVANKDVKIVSGSLTTTLSYDSSAFNVILSGGTNTYKFSLIDGTGFGFYVNGNLVAKINASAITFNQPVTASKGTFGGLVMHDNYLYQGTANAESSLYINYYGYGNSSSYYRNTYIGNGKGSILLAINGASGSISANGQTTITTNEVDALILKNKTYSKNNASLVNAISWKDSAGSVMARAGFTSTADQIFRIICSSYDIEVTAGTAVNIGPAIKEGGVLLSEKYVLVSDLESALGGKINVSDVYSTTQADAKFATKAGGLSQFVNSTNTAAVCRTQIGAVGSSELSSYAKLSNFLSDMATSDANKKKIRDNIGAAAVDEFQTKLTDSGWILVKDSLYVRQIGNIVSVQGTVKTVHSGTVFTIPNSIQAPTHAVKHCISFANNRNWVCKIDAGQRACTVVYCDSSCSRNTEFSLSYMI